MDVRVHSNTPHSKTNLVDFSSLVAMSSAVPDRSRKGKVVNDTLIEPRTWIPGSEKWPLNGPLYGRPFTSNPFENGNSSTIGSAGKSLQNETLEKSKANDDDRSREAVPLPPRTLYGPPASGPYTNSSNDEGRSKTAVPLPPRTLYGPSASGLYTNGSVALVDSSAVAKISSPSGLEQSLLHHQDVPLQIPLESGVVPASSRRAAIVRSASPRISTIVTVTKS